MKIDIFRFLMPILTGLILTQTSLAQVCSETPPAIEPITAAVNTPLFNDLGLRVSYIGVDPADSTRLRIQTRKSGVLTTHFIKLNGFTASGQFGVFNSTDTRYYIKTIVSDHTVSGSQYVSRWRVFGFKAATFPPGASLETSEDILLTGTSVSRIGGMANSNLGYMYRMQVSSSGDLFFESTNTFGGTNAANIMNSKCGFFSHSGFSKITAENTSVSLQQNQPSTLTSDGSVNLTWPAYSNQTQISGYRLYRKSLPSGSYSLIATLASSARSYVDNTNLTALNSYQYLLRPVSAINSLEVIPTNENAALQPQVTIPPQNMVFVHKSTLNKEACERVQKTPNPELNNSCLYTAIVGQPAKTLEHEKSLMIDKYELGCKVGSGVTLSNGNCTVNSKTVSSPAITDSELLQATTNAPGYTPLTQIAPYHAYRVCQAQTFSINDLTVRKRLLTMKEFRSLAAWPEELSQTQITQTETGVQSSGRNNVCNTSSAVRSLAQSLNELTAPSSLLIKTGSISTNQCVSRYGIYDLIGNVEEYVSDSVDYSTNCEDVFNKVGSSHSFAPTNIALHGYNFVIDDQRSGYEKNTHIIGAISQYSHFNPILGLANKSNLNSLSDLDKPMSGWTSSVAQQTLKGIGGWCSLLGASISLGGRADTGVEAGRWHTNAESTTGSNAGDSEKTNLAGSRCAMEVD